MLQENKYPPSQVVFVVHLALIILSWCEYMKLCIFTSVCMTHASVIAAWISLSGFLFGVFDLVCELLMLLLSIKDCSSSHTSLCLPWCLLSLQTNEMLVVFFSFQPVLKGFCISQPCLPPSSPRVHLAQPLSVGLIFWFPCFNFVADVVQSHGAVFVESTSLSTPISAPQFRGFRRASEISIASQVSGMADSYTASNIANSKCSTPPRLRSPPHHSQHHAPGWSHTASVSLGLYFLFLTKNLNYSAFTSLCCSQRRVLSHPLEEWMVYLVIIHGLGYVCWTVLVINC